jgi:hypothetical protein
LFANLGMNSFFLQTWNRDTDTWDTEGGVVRLSPGVTFGFAGLAVAPPNTQAVIGQSPACRDDDDNEIDGTACIVFNSRGIPIDNVGAPTGSNALYVTDNLGVYVTTLTATPLIRLWWSPSTTVAWVRQ